MIQGDTANDTVSGKMIQGDDTGVIQHDTACPTCQQLQSIIDSITITLNTLTAENADMQSRLAMARSEWLRMDAEIKALRLLPKSNPQKRVIPPFNPATVDPACIPGGRIGKALMEGKLPPAPQIISQGTSLFVDQDPF
jgi:hypothetical protein